MTRISSLDIYLRGNTSGLDSALDKSGAKVGEFTKGVGGASSGLSSMEGASGGASSALGLVGGAFTALAAAVAAAGVALVTFGLQRMGAMEQTARMADELGVSTEALVGLQHAADQTGSSAEAMNTALMHLSRNVSEAAHGSKEANAALAQLGLSAATLKDLSADEQMRRIADAMKNVGNAGDRTRLTMQLFGREGAGLANTLAGGSEALDKFAEDAKKLGISFGKEQAEAVEKGNAAWKRMGDALNGIGNKIAVGIAPWVEKLSNFVTDLFTSIQDGISAAEPYLEAIWDTAKGFFGMLQDIAAPAVHFIMDVIGQFMGTLGQAGLTWENIKKAFLTGLFTLQFAFAHWRDFLELAVLKVELGFVTFGNNLVHLFTVTIPTVFTAFGEFASKFLTNLGKNVAENAKAIWDFITKGGDAHFVWHDLSEGFGDAMHKIDASMKRPMTDLEKDLTKRIGDKSKSLGDDLTGYVRQKLADFGVTAAPGSEAAKDMANRTGAALGTGEHKNAALEAGSLDAYKVIAGQQGDKMLDAANAALKEAREHNKKLDKLLNALQNGGVNLAKAKL